MPAANFYLIYVFNEVTAMRDMVVLINLDNKASCALAKQLRGANLYCKVLPANTTADQLKEQETLGVILSGGSTGQCAELPELQALLDCRLPLLALGDAALTLCQHLGGQLNEISGCKVVQKVCFTGDPVLLRDVQDGERYLSVCRTMQLPPDCSTLAQSEDGVLGLQQTDRGLYALAFQPESHDIDALQLLVNFCHNICGATPWWNDHTFIQRATEEISRLAGDGEAICALSGGIDSAVCAMLGNMALGHRLHCIFIDTGLMRQDESDHVMDWFQNEMGLNIRRINAAPEVLELLKGVVGTVEKQRIVFALLRAILRREAAQLPNVRLMLQGTNFADTLDSEQGVQLGAAETHIRMIEPVGELFKDEIRSVGRTLQLPEQLCNRQPFPASGLALRIFSDVTEDKLTILRQADALFSTEIEASGQHKRLFQYYATLIDNPIPDEGPFIMLRAVQVVGGGESAISARLPNDLLERITERIKRQVPSVRRVMYDLTPSQSFSQWRSE